MAKKKVRVTKKKGAAKNTPAAEEKKSAGAPKASDEFKYTVDDLAKELGIKAASARVKLRKEGIEKAGRAYGWNKKTDFDKVVKQLKADRE